MNRKIGLLAAGILSISLLGTGCNFVTVIPIGQEGEYTGQKAFDSGEQSSSDWATIVEELTAEAKDVVTALNAGEATTGSVAVTGTATVSTYDGAKSKKYLVLTIDGYTGDAKVMIQVGGPNSTTAIRDVQTLKTFESFTNQTEWSQYAKALNSESAENVCAPLGLDETVEGKTVTFIGAATKATTSSDIIITPVSLSGEG